MATFAGRILLAGEVVEGHLVVEAGRVAACGAGEPPEPPVAEGWIVPAPVNAHTHVGDAFLRDRPGKPARVRDLVGPAGWKHRELAQASAAEQEAGIRRYAGEMAALGTGVFVDFREGGLAGLRLLRRLAAGLPAAPVAYGRPAAFKFDEAEARQLLAEADGIGLSGVRDFARRDLEAWAEACRQARKPLALHVSEDHRDPVDAVLALGPAHVIHMVHATAGDLEELAQAGVPVCVAPRSNRFFGYRTPVDRMLEAGCTVAVGTDNGMLNDGDLLAELGQLAAWHPAIPTEDLLRMATHGGRAVLGLDPLRRLPRRGDPAEWVVLPPDPVPRAAGSKPTLGIPTA